MGVVAVRVCEPRAEDPPVMNIKDLGIGKLRQQIADLDDLEVSVGVQGKDSEKRYLNGATLAQVAAWHEYGTKKMPARPFIRHTLTEHADAIAASRARMISNLINGRAKTVRDAAIGFGKAQVGLVRETIVRAEEWAEPLAPSTVKKKGFADPLIETGTMVNSVSWAIREGGEIVEQGYD